jgi:hypothetical protein
MKEEESVMLAVHNGWWWIVVAGGRCHKRTRDLAGEESCSDAGGEYANPASSAVNT